MRKSTLFFSPVLLVAFFAQPQKTEHMLELKTEIVIQAPTQVVWKHLTQLDAYSSWNPFIVQSEGAVEQGVSITNVMINGGKQRTFKPTITKLEDAKTLEWLGKMPLGLFNGNHYFHLEKIDGNTTRLIHGERFTGLLHKTIMKKIGDDTRRGFEAMNVALKARCEQ